MVGHQSWLVISYILLSKTSSIVTWGRISCQLVTWHGSVARKWNYVHTWCIFILGGRGISIIVMTMPYGLIRTCVLLLLDYITSVAMYNGSKEISTWMGWSLYADPALFTHFWGCKQCMLKFAAYAHKILQALSLVQSSNLEVKFLHLRR